jgi:putative DeoR family transcriptional regulator (stage III sporulation protein D)
VYLDVAMRLREFSPVLASEVMSVLEYNKSVRHHRGGYATKLKYKGCVGNG